MATAAIDSCLAALTELRDKAVQVEEKAAALELDRKLVASEKKLLESERRLLQSDRRLVDNAEATARTLLQDVCARQKALDAQKVG